jgi:hypothetical protein
VATFTTAGKEYQMPVVPVVYDQHPNLAKAWNRGWHHGIWKDTPAFRRYKRSMMQAAFENGHRMARQQRRDSGEQVPG